MKKRSILLIFWLFFSLFCLFGCGNGSWNNPHSKSEAKKNIYYSSFSERPKTLDPARAYSSNETQFTAQIYEPPLQYHYLKRPYTLVPLASAKLPTTSYFDKDGKVLPLSDNKAEKNKIAYTVYEIEIQPNIYYQPHPAFAKRKKGGYLYHKLTNDDLDDVYALSDFKKTDTRELTAADYIYQIKRLAHPAVQSPILGLMGKYIVGLKDYNQYLTTLSNKREKEGVKSDYIDLRKHDFAGVEQIDRYTYRIKLKGQYPQFNYWLAMPFFSPIPWEADRFYSQTGMKDKNITLDWYPIGTGPYMLVENNPNRRMVLKRNPNFHKEFFPTEGEKGDRQKGFLEASGQSLPFVDKFIFTLEKESIPRWTKFLQGYYDQAGIGSDVFDQAIKIDSKGKPYLTPDMKSKNLRLQTNITPAIYYIGFNMLDSVVGGKSERARKLRQAIAIAINYEEFISIFLNGRGIPAHSPIPSGIFGFKKGEEGINPYIYDWKKNGLHGIKGRKGERAVRKPIAEAKKLLREAGYPDGRDAKTGKPLLLYLDIASSSGPDDKARFEWFRKQFAKLGIQLQIRGTQYNRFQEKMRHGDAQIFMWGWLADYPDPENFLFLLYGPNGKVKVGGENAANYSNKKFDGLFEKMKDLPNGLERQTIIDEMVAILQKDVPWVWGFHPKSFQLTHHWLYANKPNEMANNTLKYLRLNPALRAHKRTQWNIPIIWPIGIFLLLLIGSFVPVVINYWRKEHSERDTKKF